MGIQKGYNEGALLTGSAVEREAQPISEVLRAEYLSVNCLSRGSSILSKDEGESPDRLTFKRDSRRAFSSNGPGQLCEGGAIVYFSIA